MRKKHKKAFRSGVILIVVVVSQRYTSVRSYSIAYFTCVRFIVRKLYISQVIKKIYSVKDSKNLNDPDSKINK